MNNFERYTHNKQIESISSLNTRNSSNSSNMSNSEEMENSMLSQIEERIGNRVSAKMLADITAWIYALPDENLDAILKNLELKQNGSIYQKMDRLRANLLGEYNPEDFIENDVITETEELNKHRTTLIKSCLNQTVTKLSEIDKKKRKTLFNTHDNTYPDSDAESDKMIGTYNKDKSSSPIEKTDTAGLNTTAPPINITATLRKIGNSAGLAMTLPDGQHVIIPMEDINSYASEFNAKARQQSKNLASSTKISARRSVDFQDTYNLDYPYLSEMAEIPDSRNDEKRTKKTPKFNASERDTRHTSYTDSQRFENRTGFSFRTNDLSNIIRKWNLHFSGDKTSSIEEFIEEAERRAHMINMSQTELLLALPDMLTGIAKQWYKSFYKGWKCWGDFCFAARRHFGAGPNFQYKLENEALHRTQGEDEPVRNYIFNLLAILDKFEPALYEDRKLDFLYRNLNPKIKTKMWENDYDDLNSFIDKAITIERSIESRNLYRPPPPPEQSLLPEMAYKPNSKAKKALQVSEVTEEQRNLDIAAIMQEMLCVAREVRTQKDARLLNKEKSNSSSSSESEGEKQSEKNHSTKRYTKKADSYPERNSGQDYKPRHNIRDRKNWREPAKTAKPQIDNKSQSNSNSQGGTRVFENRNTKNTCQNCNKTGHSRRECPDKLYIRCYSCGKPDVTTRNCPKCSVKEEGKA